MKAMERDLKGAIEAGNLRNLIDWGQSNGVELPESLEFVYDDVKGICCLCTKNLSSPTLKIPHDIIICADLIPSVFPSVRNGDSSNTWLKFLLAKLMYDKECAKTDLGRKFRPYLDCLPEVVDSPLVWNSAELALLKGTNLGNSIADKLRSIFKEWNDLVTSNDIFDMGNIRDDCAIYENFDGTSHEIMFNEILQRTASKTPPIWYSFSAFLWSHLIFLSRAFPEYIINKDCEQTSVMLLPVIDLLNHDYHSKVEWYPENYSFCYRQLDDIMEGQELYNNYGGKGNEELLAGYGFVLEENMFDSVALKIKIPLDVISKILEEEPLLKLPTIDDYTTFAFEPKTPKESRNKGHETNTSVYEDGVTYFINKSNSSCLDPLMDLFAYLCKTSDEKWIDLLPRFKGLQNLRNALQYKLDAADNKADSIEINTNCEVKPHRKHCANLYRAGQVAILKHAIFQLKHQEKELMKTQKAQLLTMKKLLKYDTNFANSELPAVFEETNNVDIAFESTFEFLVMYILLKVKNNSWISKYSWLEGQYNTFCASNLNEDEMMSDDIQSFYSNFFENNGLSRNITLREAKVAFEFVLENSFTRVSSVNQETIIVKK